VNSTESWITLAVGVAMALGIVGVFLPGFPDLLLIWGAALAYGLLAGWGRLGPWLFAGITLSTIAGLVADV